MGELEIVRHHGRSDVARDWANNCPFFGCSGVAWPRLLFSEGNQCALKVDTISPCAMERRGERPDWRVCEVAQEAVLRPSGGPDAHAA